MKNNSFKFENHKKNKVSARKGQAALFAAALLYTAAYGSINTFADSIAVYPDLNSEVKSIGSEVKQTNNFSRGSKEWKRLEDNELDWDEIPALIHEYNANIITNRSELSKDERRSMDSEEVSSYLLDKASDYESQADAMDDVSGKELVAANLRIQANNLRRQADSNLDDFDVVKLSYEQIEKQTVLSAKTQFLDYYTALLSKDSSASNLEYLERAYNSAVNRKNAAVGTELEVLTAKLAWDDARADAVTLDNKITANRQSLIVSCGWKYDADAVIGKLPEYDAQTIANVNYEEDKKKAEAANITLKIDNIRVKNASDSGYQTLVEEQKTNLKKDLDSFGINFKAAYDGLINAVTAYNNAVGAKANSDKDLTFANKQYALGMISKVELMKTENSAVAAHASVSSAYNQMVLARVKYDAAVNDGIL